MNIVWQQISDKQGDSAMTVISGFDDAGHQYIWLPAICPALMEIIPADDRRHFHSFSFTVPLKKIWQWRM